MELARSILANALPVVTAILVVTYLAGAYSRRRTRKNKVAYVVSSVEDFMEGYDGLRQRYTSVTHSIWRWSTGWLTGSVDGFRWTHRPDARARLLSVIELPAHAAPNFAGAGGGGGVQLRGMDEILLPPNPLDPPAGYDEELATNLTTGRFPYSFFEQPSPETESEPADNLLTVCREGVRASVAAVRGRARATRARATVIAATALLWVRRPRILRNVLRARWARLVADMERRAKTPRTFTKRAVLTVYGPRWARLATDGTLNPSLMGIIADIYRDLDMKADEDAEVIVDCGPVGWVAKLAYFREVQKHMDQDFMKTAAHQGNQRNHTHGKGASAGSTVWKGLNGEWTKTPATRGETGARGGSEWRVAAASPSTVDTLSHERQETRARVDKSQPLVRVRVTIKARSRSKKRARAKVKALSGALAPLHADARFTPAGIGINLGRNVRLTFIGADAPILRWATDRNIRLFKMPTSSRPVSIQEIAPLVGPATAGARSENVRHHGHTEQPPRELARYDRWDPDLLPGGIVTDVAGNTFCTADRVKDMLLKFKCGRSGNGKSETEWTAIIHTALNTDAGVTYLDPEGDAYRKLEKYLAPTGRRIQHVNLRDNEDRQYGWNPLDMSQRKITDTDEIVETTVGQLAHACNLSAQSNRALAMLNMVLETLLSLNIKLCQARQYHLQATLFTINPLITSETFRKSLYPYLDPEVIEYWEKTFPDLAPEAKTVITNLIDRMRGKHSALGAFLGRSQSTLNFETSMERGDITIISLPTDGDKEKLVAQLILWDLVRSARQREEMEAPKTHYLYMDEAQMYDQDNSGDSPLNRAFATLRKRKVKVVAMTQAPTNLNDRTREGIYTNVSHMLSGPMSGRNASVAASGLDADANVLKDLDRFWWAARGTVGELNYGPCRMRGVTPSQVYGDIADESRIPDMRAHMDGLVLEADENGEAIIVDGIRLRRDEIPNLSTQHLAVESWVLQEQRRARADFAHAPQRTPDTSGRFTRKAG